MNNWFSNIEDSSSSDPNTYLIPQYKQEQVIEIKKFGNSGNQLLMEKNNTHLAPNVNPKNFLQEYYQKRQLDIPKYKSKQVGGDDHTPKWQSKVILSNGKKFIGNISTNKSKAEMSAAEKALSELSSNNNGKNAINTKKNNNSNFNKSIGKPDKISNIKRNINIEKNTITHGNCSVSDRTVLIIDVENLHNFVDEVCAEIEGLDIYAFIGCHHSLVAKKVFPHGVKRILVPSTRSDGSDTCIQVYVGYWLAQNKYDTYLIATRDHFGSSLVDMITSDSSDLPWGKKNARIVTQLEHIY